MVSGLRSRPPGSPHNDWHPTDLATPTSVRRPAPPNSSSTSLGEAPSGVGDFAFAHEATEMVGGVAARPRRVRQREGGLVALRNASSSWAAQDLMATVGVSPPYSRTVLACFSRSWRGRRRAYGRSCACLTLHVHGGLPDLRDSLPLALGVFLECIDEAGIALASSERLLDEVDALPEVGQSGCCRRRGFHASTGRGSRSADRAAARPTARWSRSVPY